MHPAVTLDEELGSGAGIDFRFDEVAQGACQAGSVLVPAHCI